MLEVGQPIRSDELNRLLESAAESAEHARVKNDMLARELQMVQLALHARTAPEHSGDGLFLKALPHSGAEFIGSLVASERAQTKTALFAGSEGTGAIEMLREGSVWSGLSSDAETQVSAAVQPAYRTGFNELFVPHIAGVVGVTLHSDTGERTEVRNITSSRLVRYDEVRPFNGRVTFTSRAAAGLDQQFIHSVGGLHIRQSAWAGAFDAKAVYQATQSGSFIVDEVKLFPSGRVVTDVALSAGNTADALVTSDTNAINVEAGNTVHIIVKSINSTEAISHFVVRHRTE